MSKKYVVATQKYSTEYLYRIYSGEIIDKMGDLSKIRITEFVAGVVHKSDMDSENWYPNSNIFDTKKEAVSACIKMFMRSVLHYSDIKIIDSYVYFFNFLFRNGFPPISNWPKLIKDLEELGW